MRPLHGALPLLLPPLLACPGCGSPGPPETPAAPAPWGDLARAEWTDLGRILGPADFGQAPGTIIGDPTGVLLPDGRIRLFVFVEGHGVWRALATDASGTAFRVEGPCTLVPDPGTNTQGTPWGEPRVVAIPGGLRMFYMQDQGIASATSADHLTWRQEPGLRITSAQAGFRATTTGSVVPTRDGGWRMYFSERRDSPADPATAMKSATSRDMLAWTMDSGVRVGPGAPLDQNATDPFVFAHADGSVTAWYLVQQAAGSSFHGPGGLYAATSADGLGFPASTRTSLPGGNPNLILRADGTPMMYLSATDPLGGPGIRAAQAKR
ncbi:MAG: hypothetical protein HY823_00130 [Acidobacteria bacterium]|nr:hypothetical protein [Acidobacteriota bacterium]